MPVGLAAQPVDGAPGMAFGLVSSSVLPSTGLPPPAAAPVTRVRQRWMLLAAGLPVPGISAYQVGSMLSAGGPRR